MRDKFLIIAVVLYALFGVSVHAKTPNTSFSANSTVASPDFAYPEEVTEKARKDLSAALNSRNGKATVRALANIALAQSAIGNDRLQPVVNQIQEIKSTESDSVTRSLLSLLLADIYSDIYSNNKYVYDRREIPLSPLPADYNEWSGAQFRARIDSLCADGLASAEILKTQPLKNYSDIITASPEALIYYPTLYDFACLFTIEKRMSLSPFSNLFPLIYLTPFRIFAATPVIVPASPVAASVLDTYEQWTKFHECDVAPLINVDLRRIDLVTSHIYNNQQTAAEQKRTTLLRDLYEKYKDSEFSGDILIELAQYGCDNRDADLYADLCRNIDRFPNYHRKGCLENILTRLKQQSCNVSAPAAAAPSSEIALEIGSRNMPEVIVDIYKVNLSDPSANYYRLTGVERLVKSIYVTLPGTVPFQTDTIVKTSLPEFGYYIVKIREDKSRNSYNVIRSSQLALTAATLGSNATLIAFDPATGSPIDKAEFYSISRSRNAATTTSVGLSGKNGFREVSITSSSKSYGVRKGSDIYAPVINLWRNTGSTDPDSTINLFTDLSLYHPGDTIQWTAILYRFDRSSRKVIANADIKATFNSPNGSFVADTTVKTDEFGRAGGFFIIPEAGLTGNGRLMASCGRAAGSSSPMISDYKLPSFVVVASAADRNTPKEGDVTLRGSAETYSGAPVANATVTLNLGVEEPAIWSRYNSVEFYSATTATDAEGKWNIQLPASLFSSSPCPDGIYTARITVTSTAGESREASKRFTLGPTCILSEQIPSSLDIDSPVTLAIKLIDGENKPVAGNVHYYLRNVAQAVVDSGILSTSRPIVDWSALESGTYNLRLSVDGNSNDCLTTLILYHPGGKTSPVSSPLWSPVNDKTIEVNDRREAEILYAVDSDNGNVLLILSSSVNEKIIEQRWIKASRGFNTLRVKLPAGVDKARANLLSANNYRFSTISVNILKTNPDKKLAIVAESFRDNLVPGNSETWRFKTINGDSIGVKSAFMIDMYNAAINDISGVVTNSWSISPRLTYSPSLSIQNPEISGSVYTNFTAQFPYNNACQGIQSPAWQLYGRQFTSNLHIRGSVRQYKLMNSARSADTGMEENMIMETAVDATADYAAPAMVTAGSAIEEESGAGEKTITPEPTAEKPFEYRRSELPIALYQPMLTTDPSGLLSYSFTVPNANATWSFNAASFTPEMAAASFNAAVRSSKPVMVQPNLPRFLRCGDKAVVRATVMNQSETTLDITTITELFDVATGAVTASFDTITTIPPGASTIVSCPVTAPTDAPFIGFRIKSFTADFADGEQSFIEILPFTTPVIDTYPFYMAADSSRLSFPLPSMPADAKVTLQFCSNPLWYVVTALPGLSESKPSTSIAAAANIFAASVARGLFNDYPHIAAAIKEWNSSDRSDSTLVSMLSRNADLKTVLISATPWMMDARSDTERMTRLALLFDNKQVDASINEAINLLSKLQQPDGGFSWQENFSQSSLWATQEVLRLLGATAELGYLPSDKYLAAMTTKSLEMVQRETVKLWKKYPSADYSDYVALMDLWPSFTQSADSRKIVAYIVQSTLKNWKKQSVANKVESAILLYRHGYPSVARQLISSLRQYAESSPTSGMYWPSVGDAMGGSMTQLLVSARALRAFSLIEGSSKDVDAIRQWLILQKETRNWGSSSIATTVVAAIIKTTDKWIDDGSAYSIFLSGQPVAFPLIDRRLGYMRTNLSTLSPSVKLLSIDKSVASIAWGAVYCQYSDLMTSVKPQACEALSIEKKLLKKSGSEWMETTDIKVGDRVKVMLTIKANRDLQYVAITDDRAACLEPVEQLPAPIFSEGICFYRENRDSRTSMFVSNLPKGVYLLSYELWVNNEGTFASGIASAQSQYAPQIAAHSGGSLLISQ